MTGWKIPIVNRKYIFKMVDFQFANTLARPHLYIYIYRELWSSDLYFLEGWLGLRGGWPHRWPRRFPPWADSRNSFATSADTFRCLGCWVDGFQGFSYRDKLINLMGVYMSIIRIPYQRWDEFLFPTYGVWDPGTLYRLCMYIMFILFILSF